MSNQDYWQQFIKTGNVYDYLNYTACTREDKYGPATYRIKEGEQGIDDDSSDRNGPVFDVYR